MRRLVVPITLQLKLMFVLGTWANNIKMKRMENSVKRLLYINYSIKSKISQGIRKKMS